VSSGATQPYGPPSDSRSVASGIFCGGARKMCALRNEFCCGGD